MSARERRADDASRLDAAIGKAMQRGATSKNGALVACSSWVALKAPGASAAHVVAAVGDVLVQSLAVTFTPTSARPSWYGDQTTYIWSGETARGGARLRRRLSRDRCSRRRTPPSFARGNRRRCARTRLLDGISDVPAAVAPFLGGRASAARSPPAIAALESIAAAAMAARPRTR